MNFNRIKEKIFVRHMASSLVRIPEKWLLGDHESIILNELSHILQGNEVILDIGAGIARLSLTIQKIRQRESYLP